jgi:hypothetical protein
VQGILSSSIGFASGIMSAPETVSVVCINGRCFYPGFVLQTAHAEFLADLKEQANSFYTRYSHKLRFFS